MNMVKPYYKLPLNLWHILKYMEALSISSMCHILRPLFKALLLTISVIIGFFIKFHTVKQMAFFY